MNDPPEATTIDLRGFTQVAADRGLGVDGVHVFSHRRGAAEQHEMADLRREVFSVSKTFTSVAVGIARDEGLLDLDDPVLQHLPQLKATAAAGVAAITIRHLLQMTSGIVYRWNDEDADHPGDPAEDILATSLGSEPGTEFAYRGGSSYLLSRIIHACSGAELRDFLVPRLFAPLGINNPQWLRCPLGFSLGAVGLQLRTEEVARLGRTLLDGGRYADRQLVSADYVAEMITDPVGTGAHLWTEATETTHPQNAVYGLHVWLCDRDDAWRMDGLYGQFCVIFPHQQACVTVTSHYREATTDILDAIWSEIVPALGAAD